MLIPSQLQHRNFHTRTPLNSKKKTQRIKTLHTIPITDHNTTHNTGITLNQIAFGSWIHTEQQITTRSVPVTSVHAPSIRVHAFGVFVTSTGYLHNGVTKNAQSVSAGEYCLNL
jgi:hypothetical protein